MKDLQQKLLAIFQVEYREHLTRVRAILGTVESGRGTLAGAPLDEAFRRAHSLKGAARAVGLAQVEKLSHQLETVFANLRDGVIRFSPPMIPVFHMAVDSLEDTVSALIGGGVVPKSDALEALAAIAAGHTPKVNGYEGRGETKAVPHSVPLTIAPVEITGVEGMLRVSTGKIDRILEVADELLIESIRHTAVSREFGEMVREASRASREQALVREQSAGQLRSLGTHPEFSSVVSYINYLEHQVHDMHSNSRNVASRQKRNAWNLRQLTRDLHDGVEQARMVPAESLYEGFGKMVRDLARSRNKEVSFEASGLGTLADRRVLESLRDPIMHLLRNAVDHAIETPELRRRKSKPPAGSIRLTLDGASGKLQVTVEDDGNGLDRVKIAGIAARRGGVASPVSGAEAPADLTRLIFQPGFTTAETVSDLSGRGMGLSVVHEEVMRLQGQVEARDNPAGGTTFVITTPLAVFSQHLVLVSCGGQVFAIPAHTVQRLHRADATLDFEAAEGRRMFCAGGESIPVVILSDLLGFEPADVPRRKMPLLVVKVNGRRMAMVVDSLLSDRQSVIQEIGTSPVFGDQAAGGILLEDGSVAVVLNLGAVLRDGRSQATGWKRHLPVPATEEEKKRPTVLVVDDSMTTRTLEKNILEANGFTVEIAGDGAKALTKLDERVVDLVITDVEMPLMDGFALIQAMKKEARLARIPIIIVSSLEKREDQERGLALGADAYVVKRSFEQQELLEVIRQIL